MKYNLTQVLENIKTECLVLGYFDSKDLEFYSSFLGSESTSLLPKIAKKLQSKGDFAWQSFFSDNQSLLLVNCGKAEEFSRDQLKRQFAEITASLLKSNIKTVSICMPKISDFDAEAQLLQMVQTIEEQTYALTDYKTKDKKQSSLTEVNIYLKDADKAALAKAEALAAGMSICKTLANLPANRCTPSYIAEQAQLLANESNDIKVTVFDKPKIKELKMGGLLAVSQGSEEPPRFIEIIYNGDSNKKAAPIVLVGKGVTFDSGGLSIKPAAAMDEMKYDMAGAASVIGTIKACALLKLPVSVVGLIATTENLPSGTAVKPGDIISTMSGQTVEILNTDAEGRLILADALCYAERFNPKFVIDIATLTGAVLIALGHINSGLMTTDDKLAKDILKAGKNSADPCWQLPLEEAYQDALDSPLADMINANFDRVAGSVTAACFLSRFTKKYPWAHLDIAGTAWVSGKKRHATGRPVPLLLELLCMDAYAR